MAVETIAPMETFVEVMDIIMDAAPEAQAVDLGDTSGCYLTFEPTNNGTLFTNWSHERVENTLRYSFFPAKRYRGSSTSKEKGGREDYPRHEGRRRPRGAHALLHRLVPLHKAGQRVQRL